MEDNICGRNVCVLCTSECQGEWGEDAHMIGFGGLSIARNNTGHLKGRFLSDQSTGLKQIIFTLLDKPVQLLVNANV